MELQWPRRGLRTRNVTYGSSAKQSGTLVACKIVNPRADLIETSVFANVSKRFAREAANGQKLSHDAVVRYLDSGTDADDRAFLVMELATRSIADALKEQVKFKLPEAEAVVRRVCEGLAYLHATNTIHRDVKPANMLDMPRGVVLGDFGIVQWGEWSPAFTSAGTITRNSVQLGSWYYMAPEQSDAPHQAVPTSDIYSLGVSWYELLSGSTPAPTAFAAGRVPPATDDARTNNLIAAITKYDAAARPSAADLLKDLKAQP